MARLAVALDEPRTRASDARRSGAWRRSPWTVATLVLLFYSLWTAVFFAGGHDARDLTFMGDSFLRRSHASSVIAIDPNYRYYPDHIGYDGQWAYYLALDPPNARYYMDKPAYRYTRILYPMTARLLALGQPNLIPYTLLLVNLLALGGGTLAVAAWLKRKGISPWLALIYGFYPGLFISLQHDLNEPLAYALLALAVYLFDFGGRRRLIYAGLAFAFAILARETAAVFAALYGLALLAPRPCPAGMSVRLWKPSRVQLIQAATLLGLALAPALLYRLFLRLWLGNADVPADVVPELIPFRGILSYWPWQGPQIIAAVTVIAPALICAAVGVRALWRRLWRVEVFILLANVQLFVVMLAADSFPDIASSARVTASVVPAALFCLPAFDSLTRRNRTWLLAAAGLWLALLPWLLASNFYFW
jgi:hypothetical protein